MTKIIAALVAVSIATTALAYCVTGFYLRSEYRTVAGNYTQVCIYNVNGDEVAVMYPATKVCPISREFCF